MLHNVNMIDVFITTSWRDELWKLGQIQKKKKTKVERVQRENCTRWIIQNHDRYLRKNRCNRFRSDRMERGLLSDKYVRTDRIPVASPVYSLYFEPNTFKPSFLWNEKFEEKFNLVTW